MCNTTVNDGGLLRVLQASATVSTNLYSLARSPQKIMNQKTDIDADTIAAGAKRKPSRSLSEISGNTDRSIRMDLAQHAPSDLKEVVSPLIKSMEKLDAAALLSLNPTKNNPRGSNATLDPQRGLTIPPIHDRVSPQYSKHDGPNIVRYLHVKEVPHKYSVGIFIFPPNTHIPLHDHPDMVVVSRVLYGELQVQSFDVLPSSGNAIDDQKDSSRNSNNKRTFSQSKPPSALTSSLIKIKQFVSRAFSYHDSENDDGDDGDEQDMQVDDNSPSALHVKPNMNPMGAVQDESNSNASILSAPNVTCLFPHEGNCHSFVAGPNGAAVIDVLLPPYDSDNSRDCTFYKAHEDQQVEHEQTKQQQASSASYTLSPIEQPSDFRCLSGAYGRFGSCDEYCEEENDGHEDENHTGSLCNLS